MAAGYTSFSSLVEYYSLMDTTNCHPGDASRAAADKLYRVDQQHGGDDGRYLPSDAGNFVRQWIAVEQLFVANYNNEVSRLATASRPGGGSPLC